MKVDLSQYLGLGHIITFYYRDIVTSYYRDTCSSMCIATVFIVDRNWKQPKFLSTDEQIMKNLSIYTLEYYSAVR